MYAQYSAAGLYGSDQVPAAFGIAIPTESIGAGTSVAAGDPGTGAWVAVPRDFWRSSGFGLVLLVLLVIYFDVRLLNR